MAVGNIVGLEPLPSGGYNFVDKAGTKKTLFGPAADELAERFRTSEKLAGPQPTAMNDGAGGTSADDLVTRKGGFGGFGGQVPQTLSDVPKPVPGAEGPPASIARESAEPQQPAAPSLAQAGAQFTDDKGNLITQTADGSWVKVKSTPGSRGGMVEKSRTVAGGFDQDPAYLEATGQAFANQAGGLAAGAQIAAQEAEMERGYLQQKQQENVAKAQAQQDQVKALEDGVRAKQAEYDMINERYKTQKVDPFRGMGTFQRVMQGVAAALGAFGAGMTRGPNFAQEMINGYIERNIREQEREIAVKREQAGNALSDLEKRLGSRDMAKAALGAIMTERAQLQLAQQAGALKAPKAIAAYQTAQGQLTQQYADKLEEYRQKASGNVTRSVANMPATAGGTSVTPLSLEEAAKVKNLYKGDGTKRDPGAVKEERELSVAAERLNFYEDRLARYQEEEVPLVSENRTAPGRAYAAVRDWAVGAGSTQRGLEPEERELVQDYNQIKTDLTGAIAKGAGTGTLSDGDRAAIEQGLAPGATVGMLRRAIAAARETNQRSQEVIKRFGRVPAAEIPTRPVE